MKPKLNVVVVAFLLVAAVLATSAFAPMAAPNIDDGDIAFLSSLAQSVLMAILPVAAVALVRWLIALIQTEKSKLDQNTLTTLHWLTSIAVQAAEQSKASGYISNKKQYALSFCQNWLEQRKINIDLQTLSAAIEASVMDEFNKKQPK